MKNIAIIGTGTMGPGMAATLARGGMDVACYDASDAARDKTPGEVSTALAVLERIGGPAAPTPGAVTMSDRSSGGGGRRRPGDRGRTGEPRNKGPGVPPSSTGSRSPTPYSPATPRGSR